MTKFDQKNFKKLIGKFYDVTKRILQNRPISAKKSKRNEYIELLIINYNAILSYTVVHVEEFSSEDKTNICSTILYYRDLLIKCFGKLDCKIKVQHEEDLFTEIDRNVMSDSDCDSKDTNEDTDSQGEGNKVLFAGNSNNTPQSETGNKNQAGKSFKNSNMATVEQKKSFISMCASIIRDNYDGNPLSLCSFLDKIELIEDLTEENLKVTLIAFLKSKLEGKAREALPETVRTIDDIKTSLKTKIKPENSKVVAGKIAALHVKNNNYADFSKQAEELADALERSLVIEGMTKAKAHEMAIEQTVSVCRLNARTDLVKSILASTNFSDPKDVVAKLVVEQTNESRENQVLAFHSRSNNSNNFSNRNTNNRFNGNRDNNFYRSNTYNRGGGYSRDFHGNRGNQNRNNFNRNRGNNRYNFNSSGNSSNNRNARAFPLNAEGPQQELLGDLDQN